MARSVGITKVPSRSRPSFVYGSRPPDLYAPRLAERPQGNIIKNPPRITAGPTGASTRNYAKTPPSAAVGFGDTGLTSES